jgi:hypothetical protein
LIKKAAAGPKKKKKVQSTLFPTTDNGASNKQQSSEKSSRPSVSSQILPQQKDDQTKDSNNSDNKRPRSSSSTVTPPEGGGLVFRLNKKHKVGGAGGVAKVSISPAAKKAELSEDELQSDFSDDEGMDGPTAAPRKSENKKPIEKYLQKRKMESIDSVASVNNIAGSKKRPYEQTSKETSQEEEEMPPPRPVSKESCRESNSPSSASVEVKEKSNNSTTAAAKSKDRKMVQTFLFGKPPPNGLPNELSEAGSPSGDNEDGSSTSNQKVDVGGGELQPQSSAESIGVDTATAAAAPPKGKQRSIKSWFQPKK